MWKQWRITVIIPCLNEEQGVEQVLEQMPDYVDETIVVDNGSTDQTAQVAKSFGAKVIREDVRGYGRAYKKGFANATGDIIITLDGDHSYPVDALSYLLSAFEHLGVDFLNASRFPVRDAQSMSFKHRFGNWVLSVTTSLLFFRWVRDSQSGMWVFRRSILDKIRLESDSMPFSEDVIRSRACGCSEDRFSTRSVWSLTACRSRKRLRWKQSSIRRSNSTRSP